MYDDLSEIKTLDLTLLPVHDSVPNYLNIFHAICNTDASGIISTQLVIS